MLFLGLAVFANAQTSRVGIKGGINFNKVKIDTDLFDFNSDNSLGFNFGAVYDYALPVENLFITSEFGFATRGIEFKDLDDLEEDTKETLYYLEVPVDIMFVFPVANNFEVLSKTGPMLGFGVAASEKEVFDEAFKRFHLAWNVGLGIQVLNHHRISFDYNFGLNNIAKEDDGKVHMNNFGLSYTYMF